MVIVFLGIPFVAILTASQIHNHQGRKQQIIDNVDLHRCIIQTTDNFPPSKRLMIYLLAVNNAFTLFELVVRGFEQADHFLVEQDVGVLGCR